MNSVQLLKLRWINAQCFEIKFPSGKTLLTDPFYRYDGDRNIPAFEKTWEITLKDTFFVDDIEGADYVFLNHVHGDHILNTQEVFDRFHSTIITHSATAMEFVKTHQIPLTSVYPVDFGSVSYFDGFKMEFIHGTHNPQDRMRLKDRLTDPILSYVSEDKMFLCAYGSMFNLSFILTTDQGIRIAFVGGLDDGILDYLKENPANIIIRNTMHGPRTPCEEISKKWADFLEKSRIPMMIPMHYEAWLSRDPKHMDEIFDGINQELKDRNLVNRVTPMERTKWYTLNLGLTPMEE